MAPTRKSRNRQPSSRWKNSRRQGKRSFQPGEFDEFELERGTSFGEWFREDVSHSESHRRRFEPIEPRQIGFNRLSCHRGGFRVW